MCFLHDETICSIKDTMIVINNGRNSGLADHKPAQEEEPPAGLKRLVLETEKLAPGRCSCCVREIVLPRRSPASPLPSPSLWAEIGSGKMSRCLDANPSLLQNQFPSSCPLMWGPWGVPS